MIFCFTNIIVWLQNVAFLKSQKVSPAANGVGRRFRHLLSSAAEWCATQRVKRGNKGGGECLPLPEIVRCRPCFPSYATCKPPFRSERSERRSLHRSTVNFNVNAFFATEAYADLQCVTILSSITPLRARDSVWPPHFSEKDKQLRHPSINETAQPEPAKRNPGLARARGDERAVSFARANYIERADSFARANCVERAVSSARAPHIGKAVSFARAHYIARADSFARAVHWRVRVSVLRDRPGGRPLSFTVLSALAIQRLPFPAKRNGGGFVVMVLVIGLCGTRYSAMKKRPPRNGTALHYFHIIGF